MNNVVAGVLALVAGVSGGWLAWTALRWQWEESLRRRLGFGAVLRSPLLDLVKGRLWSRTLKRHERELPDFFELLALGHSAGLSLMAAWEFAVDAMSEAALGHVFRYVRDSLRAGRGWDAALDVFSQKIGHARTVWVVTLMRQSLRRGAPVAGMLVEHVDQWRFEEEMAAERKAQLLSLKLLIPIFLFLLPAVFVVLLGPLALRLINGTAFF